MNKAGRDVTGGCQCGAIKYRLTDDVTELYACHCKECRKQSSSAFGISVIVPSGSVSLVQGAVKRWSRTSESGQQINCFFCPTCGSRVWHGDLETDQFVSIKGGSLDHPIDMTHASHIWTSRSLPGIVIPEHATTSPKEPGETDREDFESGSSS